MTSFGIITLWGCPDFQSIGPIEGIPDGAQAKLKLRERSPARLYLRKDGVTSLHHVESMSGTFKGPWKVGARMAANVSRAESVRKNAHRIIG